MQTIKVTKGLSVAPKHITGSGSSFTRKNASYSAASMEILITTTNSVACFGKDYCHIKPNLHVRLHESVVKGQKLFTDKKNPASVTLSPVAGTITSIKLGKRRVLKELLISIDNQSSANSDQNLLNINSDFEMPISISKNLNSSDPMIIKQGLIDCGLFSAFRTRPFSLIPDSREKPQHIFVTAIDTNPYATNPRNFLTSKLTAFRRGLELITQLSSGYVYVSQSPGEPLSGGISPQIRDVAFIGPHPTGNAGTHINHLFPLDRNKNVWVIDSQEVVAIGKAAQSGLITHQRVFSLFDALSQNQYLVEAPIGSHIENLINNLVNTHNMEGLSKSNNHSGYYWAGNPYSGKFAKYLRRFDRQIIIPRLKKLKKTTIPDKIFLRKLKNLIFAPSTNLIAEPWLDTVSPLSQSITPMLRALSCGDVERAEAFGCLRFDNDDIQFLSYLLNKYTDYGSLLDSCHQQIQDDLKLG